MLKGILLDLDGTLYRGRHEVPGAAGFVSRLAARGIRPLFVTNRSNRGTAEVRDHLRGFGIPCEEEDILTSAQATARILGGGRAYCIGEEPLLRELAGAGMVLTEDSPDYVVVGLDRGVTYEKLRTAAAWIRRGARFVATNTDPGLPDGGDVLPGAGAIVAAVQTASGVAPRVIGKPAPHLFDMAVRRAGLRPGDVVAVGDSLDTDIAGGRAAGIRTVLLLTGISSRSEAEAAAIRPDWIAADPAELESLVASLSGP